MERASWELVREMERATAEVDVTTEGGTAVIKVGGELDVASASRLHRVLREQCAGATSPVVLDAADVTFMDSSALRAVLAVARDTSGERSPLVLRNPSPPVRRLLAVTCLTDAVPVQT